MAKNFFKKLNNKKGFTFVECVVAIALFAIVGTLAYSMFDKSVRYMNKANNVETKKTEIEELALSDTFLTADGELEVIYPEDFVVIMIINEKNYYGVNRYYKLSNGEVEMVTISVSLVKLSTKGIEVDTNKAYSDYLYKTSDNRNLIVRKYDGE